jgi:hypothetical protein
VLLLEAPPVDVEALSASYASSARISDSASSQVDLGGENLYINDDPVQCQAVSQQATMAIGMGLNCHAAPCVCVRALCILLRLGDLTCEGMPRSAERICVIEAVPRLHNKCTYALLQ